MRCPKCHYTRQAQDQHVHEGLCPACGIAYAKFKSEEQHPQTTTRHSQPQTTASDEQIIEQSEADDEATGFRQRLIETFSYVPENMDSISFWGRVILLVVFTCWGASFVFGGIIFENINGSFLHSVILPFHEFGHVLFSPFGRFMAILGGSLFQVMLPLIVLCVFTFKQRDNYAAAIMLWWCGQSFIDVSLYIQDAEYRALPLIMGMGEEAHDWGNLLTMLGKVEMCYTYAKISFGLGTLLMMLGVAWASYLLWKIKQQGLHD